jgi:hypothetical protein
MPCYNFKFMIKKVLLILTSAFLFFSCNNGGTVDGGPCSYKETIHPAKLIKLETTDSVRYNAWLELEPGIRSSGKKDTVYSERLNGGPLYAEQIKKDSIEVGRIYKIVVKEIQEGHCTPRVDMIRFEKY